MWYICRNQYKNIPYSRVISSLSSGETAVRKSVSFPRTWNLVSPTYKEKLSVLILQSDLKGSGCWLSSCETMQAPSFNCHRRRDIFSLMLLIVMRAINHTDKTIPSKTTRYSFLQTRDVLIENDHQAFFYKILKIKVKYLWEIAPI